jgi:hypothetical protein
MQVNSWIISKRNQLAMIAADFDSCAAIEGAHLTAQERESFQKKIRSIVSYIDEECDKARRRSAKKGK